MRLKKRDGRVVAWDHSKIVNAVKLAADAVKSEYRGGDYCYVPGETPIRGLAPL